jgi:predicted transcriptional regulator
MDEIAERVKEINEIIDHNRAARIAEAIWTSVKFK